MSPRQNQLLRLKRAGFGVTEKALQEADEHALADGMAASLGGLTALQASISARMSAGEDVGAADVADADEAALNEAIKASMQHAGSSPRRAAPEAADPTEQQAPASATARSKLGPTVKVATHADHGLPVTDSWREMFGLTGRTPLKAENLRAIVAKARRERVEPESLTAMLKDISELRGKPMRHAEAKKQIAQLQQVISKAKRSMLIKLHPDKNFGTDTTELLADVNEKFNQAEKDLCDYLRWIG